MKTELLLWSNQFKPNSTPKLKDTSLLMVFGDKKLLAQLPPNFFKSFYPKAKVIGCSTSGEIYKTEVKENTLVTCALCLPPDSFKLAKVNLDQFSNFEAGLELQKKLLCPALKHIFILGEGININASLFLKGLKKDLPPFVQISGGLAGDGTHFKETLYCY